jgi:VWFA-related protein
MPRSNRPLVPVLSILALATVIAFQQSYCQTAPKFQTNVKQVLVPIVVTDKKGHPVSGLRESDFTVFEDDVPQSIVAFRKTYDYSLEAAERVSNIAPVGSTLVATKTNSGPDSPTRTYLVCVDALHSDFVNIGQARRGLTKFFAQERDDKAEYALMSLSRKIEVIQDSTRDPSAVLAALSSHTFQKSVLDSEAPTIESASAELRGMLKNFSPSVCESAVRSRGQLRITART